MRPFLRLGLRYGFAHTDVIKHLVDVIAGCGRVLRFKRVELPAQRGFLGTFAIVPWAALKRHDQDVIPNEMGL